MDKTLPLKSGVHKIKGALIDVDNKRVSLFFHVINMKRPDGTRGNTGAKITMEGCQKLHRESLAYWEEVVQRLESKGDKKWDVPAGNIIAMHPDDFNNDKIYDTTIFIKRTRFLRFRRKLSKIKERMQNIRTNKPLLCFTLVAIGTIIFWLLFLKFTILPR